jgi:uncharacterized protein (DUF924 family)
VSANHDAGPVIATPAEVLAFWTAAGPEKWFRKDAAFDAAITARFLPAHEAAAAGALSAWETSAEGALALLILLDQFPRNMFRDNARAFASDTQARAVADRAIARGFDRDVAPELRGFFYLPFMHSENAADQRRSLGLASASGDDRLADYARIHADIIRRFGRFPHRNALLGRKTSPEEHAFLEGGGFAG